MLIGIAPSPSITFPQHKAKQQVGLDGLLKIGDKVFLEARQRFVGRVRRAGTYSNYALTFCAS